LLEEKKTNFYKGSKWMDRAQPDSMTCFYIVFCNYSSTKAPRLLNYSFNTLLDEGHFNELKAHKK